METLEQACKKWLTARFLADWQADEVIAIAKQEGIDLSDRDPVTPVRAAGILSIKRIALRWAESNSPSHKKYLE